MHKVIGIEKQTLSEVEIMGNLQCGKKGFSETDSIGSRHCIKRQCGKKAF